MSAPAPPSSLHFPVDDRDLDDAELWAVIDSASAAARSRKPLLALNNSGSPNIIPALNSSPAPLKPFRTPRYQNPPAVEEVRAPIDGEVVQEEHWSSRRPQKAARLADPGTRGGAMVVLGHSPRTPLAASPVYSLPPDPGRFSVKEVIPFPLVESPPSAHKQSRFLAKEVSPLIESPPPAPLDLWQNREKGNMLHSLSGQFPSVSLFKQYQNAAMAILEKTDYIVLSGTPFIKKAGWRKISFFFNLSYEIKDKSIEFDENRNVRRAEFVVRAYMRCGRFSDGWGSCERHEKRFLKPNHDIPSTAETRAKNKACQDLLGIGEYRPSAGNGHR